MKNHHHHSHVRATAPSTLLGWLTGSPKTPRSRHCSPHFSGEEMGQRNCSTCSRSPHRASTQAPTRTSFLTCQWVRRYGWSSGCLGYIRCPLWWGQSTSCPADGTERQSDSHCSSSLGEKGSWSLQELHFQQKDSPHRTELLQVLP